MLTRLFEEDYINEMLEKWRSKNREIEAKE